MPENFDYIERYFEGNFSPGEIIAFEERIKDDPLFAEQLALYITTMQVAREESLQEKKERFRQLYNESKTNEEKNDQGYTINKPGTVKNRIAVKKLWPYIAAAAVVSGIIFSLYLLYPSPTTDQLADNYINRYLQTLSVTMDLRENHFTTGISLYNKGKLSEAQLQFEDLIQSDTANFKAKEYGGVISLRLKQYDKALHYFSQLENYPGLHANPGKFYHALTLMKRNRPGDKEKAKKLLREVVNNHLDLDNEAEELLENL